MAHGRRRCTMGNGMARRSRARTMHQILTTSALVAPYAPSSGNGQDHDTGSVTSYRHPVMVAVPSTRTIFRYDPWTERASLGCAYVACVDSADSDRGEARG